MEFLTLAALRFRLFVRDIHIFYLSQRLRFLQWREIHWSAHIWRFSGVKIGDKNFPADAGVIASPYPMRFAQALAFVRTISDRATIVHVDHGNKIITYKM